jgi:acyl-CoA synthetase (AMP-forming)/AMP-acid ligase II
VRIRVVAAAGSVLPERRLGELRIRGAAMMPGYVANPEAHREWYDEDRRFRTGDLAFARDGEVVIAGRQQDQIIVRGINYIAHEIKNVVGWLAATALPPRGVAVGHRNYPVELSKLSAERCGTHARG